MERLGRAVASGKAAAGEAERERDEAREALQAALESREGLEQERGAEQESAAALRGTIAELTEKLREAAETSAVATTEAEDRIQVRSGAVRSIRRILMRKTSMSREEHAVTQDQRGFSVPFLAVVREYRLLAKLFLGLAFSPGFSTTGAWSAAVS